MARRKRRTTKRRRRTTSLSPVRVYRASAPRRRRRRLSGNVLLGRSNRRRRLGSFSSGTAGMTNKNLAIAAAGTVAGLLASSFFVNAVAKDDKSGMLALAPLASILLPGQVKDKEMKWGALGFALGCIPIPVFNMANKYFPGAAEKMQQASIKMKPGVTTAGMMVELDATQDFTQYQLQGSNGPLFGSNDNPMGGASNDSPLGTRRVSMLGGPGILA